MGRGLAAAWAAATVAVGWLAGCGGTGDSSNASAPTVDQRSAEAPAAEAVSGAGATETTAVPDGAPQLGNLATEPGRQVILTGSIDLAVDEVAPTVAKVIVLVQGLGGVVAGEQSDYADDRATSVLTVKVPPEQFRPTLNELARLGEVSAQNVGSEDVTATVVDLKSHILTATISVERLRGYLAEARTTADVAALEGELVRREGDLEAMRGQLRSLESRVSLATIVVTVRTLAPGGGPTEDAAPGFSDAVAAGLSALVTAASAVALVVGAALPWLPVVLVVALIVAVIRRAGRRPRPTPQVEQEEEERQPEPVG